MRAGMHRILGLVITAGLAAGGAGTAPAAGDKITAPKTYNHIPDLGESKKAVGRLHRCGWAYISESRAWGCWYHAIPGSEADFANTAFELQLARDVKAADRDSLNADVRAISVNLGQVPRRAVLRFGLTFGFSPRQVREVLVHRTRIVNEHRLRLSRGGDALEIAELAFR